MGGGRRISIFGKTKNHPANIYWQSLCNYIYAILHMFPKKKEERNVAKIKNKSL